LYSRSCWTAPCDLDQEKISSENFCFVLGIILVGIWLGAPPTTAAEGPGGNNSHPSHDSGNREEPRDKRRQVLPSLQGHAHVRVRPVPLDAVTRTARPTTVNVSTTAMMAGRANGSAIDTNPMLRAPRVRTWVEGTDLSARPVSFPCSPVRGALRAWVQCPLRAPGQEGHDVPHVSRHGQSGRARVVEGDSCANHPARFVPGICQRPILLHSRSLWRQPGSK
jgi:hypothetical protein